MIRMLLALAVMIPAWWAIDALSPAWGRDGVLLDPEAASRRPLAARRAGACLALERLRQQVRAWAGVRV